jgi:NAD-dependent SIR2 family protein deacetylase
LDHKTPTIEPNPDQPVGPSSPEALRAEAHRLREVAKQLDAKSIEVDSPPLCREAATAISNRKGKVAVFLGAGASKTFGFPLTKDLLPIILRRLITEQLFEDRRINYTVTNANAEDRALLKKALMSLCPGLEMTEEFLEQNELRLPLVTSLLSMLDFSLSAGQSLVLGLTPERVKDARMLLERAIYEAIERHKPAGQSFWSPRAPNRQSTNLAKWVNGLREDSTVGVITSNYDVALEKAWGFDNDNRELMEKLKLDFGFDWTWPSDDYPEIIMRRSVTPLRRLFKLHGSTNWLRCGLCDRIYINPQVDIAVYAYDRKAGLANSCHCGHAKLEVQIVSPSFVREMRAPNLIAVWQRALDWLRQADDWIIIGYSFPDEDLNIRSLFTRGLASRADPPHITAVQYGIDDQTRMRYEAFFPSGRLNFLTGGLGMFLEHTSV